MRRFIKGVFSILLLAVLAGGAFLGYMFFKTNNLKKELEAADNLKYKITYHINGNSDVLNMAQYERDDVPQFTRWLASYIKKMEQGGSISGSMANGIIHGEVYADGENHPSIEFYYDDQAIFGIKKTLDYMIDTVEKEANVSLSLLKEVTPDGYVTYEQIQTLLGIDTSKQNNTMDLVQQAREIFDTLKWVIPVSGKDNYFSETLSDMKMIYCAPIATIDEAKGAQLKFGIGQKDGEIYLYVRMNDVHGSEGSDLEALMHIQTADESNLAMPEVVSDDIINTLSTAIQLINSFAK